MRSVSVTSGRETRARQDERQKDHVMTSSRRETSPIETAIPGRRIYLAGASGVIGSRLVPLLVDAGYTVGAMTRSSEKAARLASLGAEPIVCDVFDRGALTTAVRSFSPDLVLHELTDLPDAVEDLPKARLLNARIRVEGTRNLIDAMDGLDEPKDRGPKHRVDTGSRSRGRRRHLTRASCARGERRRPPLRRFLWARHILRAVNFRQRHACTSTPPPLEPSKPSTRRRAS